MRAAYHGADACSGPAVRASAYARRVGDFGSGSPYDVPGVRRGETGASQVAWPSSSRVPQSPTPPGAPPPRPRLPVTALLPSGTSAPWAPGSINVSRPSSCGPPARAPTHQRRCCHRRCKARYRPAGLSAGRMGFAPTGRTSEFHEVTTCSTPFGPVLAWSLLTVILHPAIRGSGRAVKDL